MSGSSLAPDHEVESAPERRGPQHAAAEIEGDLVAPVVAHVLDHRQRLRPELSLERRGQLSSAPVTYGCERDHHAPRSASTIDHALVAPSIGIAARRGSRGG